MDLVRQLRTNSTLGTQGTELRTHRMQGMEIKRVMGVLDREVNCKVATALNPQSRG